MRDPLSILRENGIQATPQRIAVMEYVLGSAAHPSADEVLEKVRRRHPTVSRSTVYNTLNLLVERGLLKTQILKEGTVVFDCNVKPHHHFIDQKTGKVYDVAWDALKVSGDKAIEGFEVDELQVVMRGRKTKR